MALARVAAALAALVLLPLLAVAAQEAAGGVAALEARAAQLRAAAAARADDFEAHLELATTLHQLDHSAPNGGKRVPEAVAAYRRAAELAAAPAARAYVLSNLGALLLAGGQVHEAGATMNATLTLARSLGMENTDLCMGLLFNLAKVEQQLGQQERAQALLRQVLTRAKGVAAASYTKAWAALRDVTPSEMKELQECVRYLRRRRKGGDEAGLSEGKAAAWRRLQARWGWLDGASEEDRSWIFFGLFSAYQQASQHDKAWRALAEGNAMQEAAAPHSTAQDDFTTAAVLQMFHPPNPGSADRAEAYYAALLQGAGGHRDASLRPVFVVGLPRSGSTLIEQILASHSQVWGAGEDTALAPLLPELLAALRPPGGMVEAAAIAAVGAKYRAEMRQRLPAERAGARWIVDKMLRNIWNLGFVAMMLPDACLLHAARHPADAGLSCFAQPFEGRGTPWANNLTHIAHQAGLVQALADHWDAVLPGRVLHVRYEDLVRDQEGTTRRMLEHCGIPWEEGVLAFHRTRRTVATASMAQVRQRLYRDSVLRYRQYARHLAPLLRPLRDAILRYEREAGLESSAALLAQVLDGSGGDGSLGGDSGGGEGSEAARDEL